jgi:hypothetical protein
LFTLLDVSWIVLADSSTVFANDGFNNDVDDDDNNDVDDVDDVDNVDNDDDDDVVVVVVVVGIKNPVLEKSDNVKNTPAAMPTMNKIC